MQRDFTNNFILNALELPIIIDIDSLSNSVGISKSMLFLLSNKTNLYYSTFDIPKKNGTQRQINSPNYSLKLVQRWILVEILEKIKVSNESMAFRKGIGNGSKNNAEHHRYSLFLLQLDINNFFTSIKKERVFYLFKTLGYNTLVSNILTNLCTLNGYLPQGGVCSPYISNLICYKLDKRLKGLSSKRDVLFTRYADDLTFSCDNKVILRKIKNVIEDIVVDEGFSINASKTRYLSPASHKKITGITINDNRIKADKKLKRNTRAMIHNSIVSGDYSKKLIIRGNIAYIDSIEGGYKEKIKSYINTLITRDYKHLIELVETYNKNKMYFDLNDMVYEEFEGAGFDDEFEKYLFEKERIDFLIKRKYIDEVPETPFQQIAGTTLEENDFGF